jgi:hypothetical protein
MADDSPTPDIMSVKEAEQLATHLASCGGNNSLAQRVTAMETNSRKASRLIRAMLRQVHSSDVFRLPTEE